MANDCPFCRLAHNRIQIETESALVFRDGFAVSLGHTLIIPKRHVESLYELTDAEQSHLWTLTALVRKQLADDLNPDGFNIGINDGFAAGQTVKHAHIHVIPRWKGDVEDPRGGIRRVIPQKARYWD